MGGRVPIRAVVAAAGLAAHEALAQVDPLGAHLDARRAHGLGRRQVLHRRREVGTGQVRSAHEPKRSGVDARAAEYQPPGYFTSKVVSSVPSRSALEQVTVI